MNSEDCCFIEFYMILFIFRQFEFQENYLDIWTMISVQVVVSVTLEAGRKLVLTLSTASVLAKGATQG